MTLIDQIVELASNPPQYYETMNLPTNWREHINNPRFDERDAVPVHDWRTHVHWIAARFWTELDEVSRLLIYLQAEYDASNENWE